MIWTEISHHQPHPCEILITVLAVRDKAALPRGHILECRVKLIIKIRLFIVQKAWDLLDLGLCAIDDAGHGTFVLAGDPGHLQGGAHRQALEDAGLAGFLTRIEDGGIDLHRFAVLAAVGAVGNDHLLHQCFVSQQLVE